MSTRFSFGLLALLLVFRGVGTSWADSRPAPGRLLLILVDGFRHDYLNRKGVPVPAFDRLAKIGAKAGGFQPAFPSLSFPNYYSIMTGLYTESHGMTDNYMYDATRQEAFLIGSNPEHLHAHWWDRGDPIWTTSVRQNKKVDMYFWPGCEVEIRGLRPTSCRAYTGIPTYHDFRSAVNDSLARLAAGKTDVSAIFFELMDKYGHVHGPASDLVNGAIREVDIVLADLLTRLEVPELSDVNLVILSDHGMTEIRPSRNIEVWKALSKEELEAIFFVGAFPLVNIFTSPAMEQQVYDALKNFHPNMKVYWKRDLPERWHYKNGPYVAPLVAVADYGWSIITPYVREKKMVFKGMHGFDPEHAQMRGIFLAKGPAFIPGAEVDLINAVDAYQLMCYILNINASPHNGSFHHVKPLLRDYVSVTPPWKQYIAVMAAIFSLMALIGGCWLSKVSASKDKSN